MSGITMAQFGLGPIGLEALKLAASTPWLSVVGAIDIDPAKIGYDLAELTQNPALAGLRVHGSFEELRRRTKPQMVFHATVSRFKAAFDQLEPIARMGTSVVSSCEELLFPQLRNPGLAAKLDRVCLKSGARVIGTGVNPGFVMDILPICMTGISSRVTAVHVQRVVNASTRRGPLQRKIGCGLSLGEFRRLFAQRKAGHAGLKESLALIAHSLGWRLGRITEIGEPVAAPRAIRTRHVQVRKGETRGLHQRAEARINGKIRLTLDLKMYLDAKDPHDAIQIEGEPSLDVRIDGGVAGDQATVAALVNTARRLFQVGPGLKLMTDLPVPAIAPAQGHPRGK